MTERQHFDVLVVGAGPAGLAAACVAAEQGRRVGVIDDNPDVGGQIWRGEKRKPKSKKARHWLDRLSRCSLEILPSAQVIDQRDASSLIVIRGGEGISVGYRHLILATGARERFLPFPGWTLPGVLGAGGLQAMVKSGLPIEGKRVVVAGSGPLLLAVADYLHSKGALVLRILEQAAWLRIFRFGLTLALTPSKLLQALKLRRSLSKIPYQQGYWPTRAEGDQVLRSITFTNGRQSQTENCDYLACGFGLVPNLELPMLLGCGIENGFVRVDEQQRSSIVNVLCAGEITGIGGLDLSLVEGEIAGLVASNQTKAARRLFGARKRAWAFARRLKSAFALRSELRQLAEPSTMVCRCEDVSFDRLEKYAGWREAKLQTRCGMGPCQGRVCGTITEQLFGWELDSVRPPLFPAPLHVLVKKPDA